MQCTALTHAVCSNNVNKKEKIPLNKNIITGSESRAYIYTHGGWLGNLVITESITHEKREPFGNVAVALKVDYWLRPWLPLEQ